MKRLLILLTTLLLTTTLWAQTNERKVVIHLTNGATTTGQLVDINDEGSVAIRRKNGQVAYYHPNHISKIRFVDKIVPVKEKKANPTLKYDLKLANGTVIPSDALDSVYNHEMTAQLTNGQTINFSLYDLEMSKKNKAYKLKQRGYFNATEVSFVLDVLTFAQSVDQGMGIRSVNGWKFNQYIAAGLGLGWEWHPDMHLMPIYGSVRLFPVQSKVMPFVLAEAGYSKAWQKEPGDFNPVTGVKGGFMQRYGAGLQFNGDKFAWTIAMGYHQQHREVTTTFFWWDEGETIEKRKMNNVFLAFGVTF